MLNNADIGASAMKERRAEQYRKFARECVQWAKQAPTELERRDFLDMAQVSMRAAAEHDGVPDWVGNPAAFSRTSPAYWKGPGIGQETRASRVRVGAKEG